MFYHVMEKQKKMTKKKVVVIGGGTGSATMLRGLKLIDDIELTVIVTVADDGGSTGRLRSRYNLPAMGDIRNVMVAMAEDEGLLKGLMEYRFEKGINLDGQLDVSGHNLGNLILVALTHQQGSLMEAISLASNILKVKGHIVPSSSQFITLFARMIDGTIVKGEDMIPKVHNRIKEVYYNQQVDANPAAVRAILKADYVILGIGSLYTSILPNMIIPQIKEAFNTTKAKRLYYCNAMTQPGETDEYDMEAHVQALVDHGIEGLEGVVFADDVVPESILKTYQETGSVPVVVSAKQHPYPVYRDFLMSYAKNQARHNPLLVRDSFQKLRKEFER